MIIVLTVLIGGGLLLVGFETTGNNDLDLGGFGDDSSDTTVPGAGEEGSTTTPPAEVAVYVANGSGVSGQALATTEQLRAAGYTAPLDPGDGAPALATVVYFLPDREAEAQGVATALGLTPDRVVAWPTPPPFAAPPEAMVIVQVGPDLAG